MKERLIFPNNKKNILNKYLEELPRWLFSGEAFRWT